ncbi:MAG: PEP-CTERM system histidine kinase PrsK [Deltaproteobacteria bacterium]|nr:PEP-CTERM system histidine kinase PrsK [Deltaproteobacteria bacterium]
MLTTLSVTTIFAAITFPLYFTLRKDTPSTPVQLFIALFMSAAVELFDLLTLYNPEQLYLWKKCSLTAEAALIPAWLWFTMTYARQNGFRAASLPLRFTLAVSPLFTIFALILPIRSFVYSPDFATEKTLFLGNNGFMFYILMFIYLVLALIQLEQTLAHTSWTARGKIKLELLGAGAFLTILIIYYSQGLLFRTINMHLVPMRSIVLLVSIAMMFYSRLKRGNGVVVRISQQIACKSAVLFAVGLYIISLGLVGEGMKYFGDGFQRAMIFSLLFFAGLGLLIILLSETVKRKARVFIHKNFYQNKYDYRNHWLQFTNRLSSSQTSASLLHAIVSEFCETFGMGTGALFIINQERNTYQQAAAISMESDDVTFGVNDPAIESLVGGRWIVDLRDNIAGSENEHHKAFFSEAGACFIIPLFMNEVVEGFIILGRPHSTNEIYIHEDFDLMRTLAKQASSTLLNLRLSDQLSCSRELAAIGKVSAFVMHDLKNLISALSLMLENARENIDQPDFQSDLLVSLGNTVTKMNGMILRLKELPEKNSLKLAQVDLLQMARETAALVNGTKLDVTGEHIIAEADREELQKVALNLMLNAVEATNGSSTVRVEVGEKESPFIRVKDDGHGIPDAFMQHVLFKPFTSTKKQGMGIGLYQSRQIIEAHGGRIEVVSSLDHGSEFTVWLPKMQAVVA